MTPARNIPLIVAAALAAAIAALLLAAASAPAAPQPVDILGTGDEPVLAGENVVFQADGPKGSHAFYSTAPGAKPRRLVRLPSDPREGANNYEYDASPSRLAWVQDARVLFDNGSAGDTFTGSTLPFGASALALDPAPAEVFVGVAGDYVAYETRTGEKMQIVVRDFFTAGGPTRTIDLADDEVPVQLAGKYLAYPTSNVIGDASELVVVDLTTGAEVLRTPAHDEAGERSFSLAPDGVLVTLKSSDKASCSRQARWVSPADPAVHVIPLTNLCGVPRISAGGRLLAVRRGSAAKTIELVTSDLSGDARVLDIAPASRSAENENLWIHDFEGTTALYSVARCGGPLTLRADVTGAFAPKSRPGACPIAIAGGSTLRATRTGKVVVDVRCAGGGCLSPSNVRLLDGTTSLGGRRWPQDEAGLHQVRNLVDIKLNATARKRLAQRGTLQVRIAATAYDLTGRRGNTTRNVTITR